MKLLRYSLLLLTFVGFLTACEDDNGATVAPRLDVPASYTFERGGASTVSFSGQTARIAMASELVGAIDQPENSLEDLNNLFRSPDGADPFAEADLNASSKSVRNKVAASAALFSTNAVAASVIKADFDGFLAGQVSEVYPNWGQLATPGVPGQVADGGSARYVNALGLEYNQAFAKGLIGALMYDQIANNYLDVSVLDAGANRANNEAGITADGKAYTDMEHKWDEAFGYLFGASADPTMPLADLGTADNFLNRYLGRVNNDADFAGIAADIEASFRTGRAAIVAGDYEERDRNAENIKQRLADVIAIRAIYYLAQGSNALQATPQNLGGAFHDLSEGYGFIYSLRFVDGDFAGNDTLLAKVLNESGNGFWDVDPAVLLETADAIGARYGIDVEEAGE